MLPVAASWRTLTPDQWSALFMPGLADEPMAVMTPAREGLLGAMAPHAVAASEAVARRQYLLAPVGGSAAYERRGRTEGAPGAGEAAQMIALKLDTLAGRLSREQLGHFQRIGTALAAALRRAPHAHLRPRSGVKAAPGAWWRYAITANLELLRASGSVRPRWERMMLVATARKRYVPLYKAHIVACAKKRKGGAAAPPQRSRDPELLALEAKLDPSTTLLFRVLAHRDAAVETAASKAPVKPATPVADPVTPVKPASRMARFFGRAPAAPTASDEPPSPSAKASSGGSSGDANALGLSADEWTKLGEAFDLTDAKLSAAAGAAKAPLHPQAMSLRATLGVDVGSMQLVSTDPTAPPVLLSTLRGLSSELQQYTAPRRVASLRIVSLSADVAGVALIRHATPPTAGAAPENAPPALELRHEKAPLDGHSDTVVSVEGAPAYVTADMAAVRRLTAFFAKPPGLDTGALAQTVTDTVSDAAAAAAAKAGDGLKAMQGHTLKMDLRLAVAAPKILLPSARGSSMLLDLGFLQLASMPSPGRGTECFSLNLSDVSATLVEPSWTWDRLDASGGCSHAASQRLLSPTGFEAQLTRNAQPGRGRPALHLTVGVKAFNASISPHTGHGFMRALRVLSPLWTREAAAWADAQYEAPIWVLTRNGSTPGRLVWARRWGVLAGEFLYLLESRDTPANTKVAFVSLRHGWEVAPVPQRAAAGEVGVLAVLPHGVLPVRAASSNRATLLRGDDADTAASWLTQLRAVRKRRHAVARRRATATALVGPAAGALSVQLDGLEHLIDTPGDDDGDAFADAVSSEGEVSDNADADAQDKFSDAASEVGTDSGSDSSAEGATATADAAVNEFFVLVARLETLTVVVSGCAPRGSPAGAPERHLVTLHMAGAAVRYGQRMHDYGLAVRLQSLVMSDHMAPPALPGTPEPYVLTSEATAVAESFPHYLRRTATAPSAALDAALSDVDAIAGPASVGASDGTALVRFSYSVWSENSPDYTGVACDITARLAAVAIAVRRPTVAALAALPSDFWGVRPAAAQRPPPVLLAPAEHMGTSDDITGIAAAASQLAAWAASAPAVEQLAPAGLGGEPRVVMRIDVAMESALTQLLLEDGTELSASSVENLVAVTMLRQATLEVKLSLGNVRLRDGRRPEGHVYRWVLDLRQHHAPAGSAGAKRSETGSLITLTFATHVKGEEADGADMSLTASMSAVRLVYLNRFVMEQLSYFNGLTAAMRRPAFASAAAAAAAAAVVTTAAAAPQVADKKAMRLSVDVAAPLLVLPRSTASADRSEIDLGSLRYRAGPVTTPCGGMLEFSTLDLQGMTIDAVGKSGAVPLIQRVDGVKMIMRRPLRGAPLITAPATDMEIDIPTIDIAMANTEYVFICVVFGENFREPADLPPPVNGAAGPAADAGATSLEPQVDAVVADAAAAATQLAASASIAASAALQESSGVDQLRFRLVLLLHDVRCTLYDGVGRARPLAEARLVAGWASLSTSAGGVTRVTAAVHDLKIADVRVTTPRDRRAVLGVESTTAGASVASLIRSTSGALSAPKPMLLLVDYSSSAADGMRIGVRLQRPSLAVDIGFLLAVGRFFVPSLAGGTAESADSVLPRDMVIRPGGMPAALVATGDVTLGPRHRLLADAPVGAAEPSFVFDGGGHALILPPAPESRVGAPPRAVVLVGPNRTLTLRNARVMRAEFLEEAVRLAPGAQLILDPSLKLIYSDAEDDAYLGASSPPKAGSPQSAALTATSPPAAAAAAAAAPRPQVAFSLELDVVGLQLRFVEMLKGEQGDGEAPADAAKERARSEAAGWMRLCAGAAMQYRRDDAGAMMGVQLNGVLIEAHLPGVLAPLPLLAPTDAAVTYTSAPGGEARVGVTTSAVDLRLSPRLLGLAGRLAASATAVFSHAPTRVSTSFQLLWTAPSPTPPRGDAAPAFMRADAADSVSRLCLWRPVAPPGYAPLGDAATAGTAPPTAAALVMRDSGAICLPPLGYKKRLTMAGGVTLWQPLPPPGCVAIGCVAAEGDAPPPVSAVRCPRAALLVESLPLECMYCDDAGAVWRVGNAAGTLVCASGCVRSRSEASACSVLTPLQSPTQAKRCSP